jgi:hypothetical protein
MKVTLVILISIISIMAIAQVFISNSTSKTEQHKYEVIKKFPEFEIRKYEAALFSSVKLGSKSYKESSRTGFGILAGYIFGDNESNEKIAMTTPVAMELGDSTKMLFMVPKSYNLENLPRPNNTKINFEKHDEKVFAAIAFDGWADNEKIEKYKTILLAELSKEKIAHTNKFIFLGYNPPYEMINRSNEVIVELINYQ